MVTADKEDARRLEFLKNVAEREKQLLKFEMSSAQKVYKTENAPGVSSVPSTRKLTEAHLKSKKTLRQSSSYTAKGIEDEPEAPQPSTVARGNPK